MSTQAGMNSAAGSAVGSSSTTSTATRTQNAAIRSAAAAADRAIAASVEDDQHETVDYPEVDDAPPIDDLPEWPVEDEDSPVGDDDEQDLPDMAAGWSSWVRLSIFRDAEGFRSHVELPPARDPELEYSFEYQRKAWLELGDILIRTQSAALTCTNPLDAVQALLPYKVQDLERSKGQGSRDRRVVISTPFGLAPLWFFAQGRPDTLYRDIRQLAQHLHTTGGTRLTETQISATLPNPAIKPNSIQRSHGPSLWAALANPHVVARHRALWPMTTPDLLLDDLGVVNIRQGRSEVVATLAILGGLETDDTISYQSVGRPHPNEQTS